MSERIRTRRQMDSQLTMLTREIEMKNYVVRMTLAEIQSNHNEIRKLKLTQLCGLAAIILLALGQILR